MKRLLVPLLLLSCSLPHAADRSHVVFVLADDLGWGDTTLRGTPPAAPHRPMRRFANPCH